jgi:hypothetical protein
MLVWDAQICRSSCLTLSGCEVFRKVAKVLHMRQCLVPGLKISSQATEDLILEDLQKCESMEEQGKLLDRAVGVNQRQNICPHSSSFNIWRGFKMSF